MIEEIAEVKSVGQGYAEISSEPQGGCSSCSSKESCSSSSDAFSFLTGSNKKPRTMRVQNPVYAKPGDKVIVGVRPNTILKGSSLMYLLPLISLLAFAMLGNLLFGYFNMNAELGSILLGMLGLYAGFKSITKLFEYSAISSNFDAVILRVVEPDMHLINLSLPASHG